MAFQRLTSPHENLLIAGVVAGLKTGNLFLALPFTVALVTGTLKLFGLL